MEKARFGSKSEAGRFAADVRWENKDVASIDSNDMRGQLNQLESRGYKFGKISHQNYKDRVNLLSEIDQVLAQDNSRTVDEKSALFDAIDNALFPQIEDDDELAAYHSNAQTLVARSPSGKVEGVVSFRTAPSDPALRGLSAVKDDEVFVSIIASFGNTAGIGSALIANTIDAARSMGKKRLRLNADAGAKGFYEKLGFRSVPSTSMSRYFDVYELDLTSGSVEKARFASRSEAGRFAATQRWKGHSGIRSLAEMRTVLAAARAHLVETKRRIDNNLVPLTRHVSLMMDAEYRLKLAEAEMNLAMKAEHPLAPDTEPDPKYGPDAKRLAMQLRYRAEQIEPDFTETILEVAARHGADLGQLGERLKTTGSLARKIYNEGQSEHGGDLQAAAKAISDSVRYTMIVDGDRYTEAVQDVLKEFEGRGYSSRNKNFWQPGDPFDSMTLKLTKDGVTVELQMLTPDAMKSKEQTHPHYEVYRDKGQPESKRRKAWQAMVDIASKTPRPAGLATLLTIGTLILQKPDWAL